jgi:predicted transposase/invertase (TIGR01784 family)
MNYDRALKARRDYENTMEYAKLEAMHEGRNENWKEGWKESWGEGWIIGWEEGIRKIVINMHRNNFPIETIAKITNLSVDETMAISAAS